jgi:hypothetical protein
VGIARIIRAGSRMNQGCSEPWLFTAEIPAFGR